MRGGFRPPMLALAAGLLGLIAVLATLQYRWVGQVSDAERERMTAALHARASAFAEEFDRELTLAYMLFQADPHLHDGPAESMETRLASRYDRWRTVARHPRLIRDVFFASRDSDRAAALNRFDPLARALHPVGWPVEMQAIRDSMTASHEETRGRRILFVRTLTVPLWEEVPALLVPAPFVLGPGEQESPAALPSLSYTLLALDRDYITAELLPALAQHHFRGGTEGFDYQLAVVRSGAGEIVYSSSPDFEPAPDAQRDATADLFGLRLQQFPDLAADVRRIVVGEAGRSLSVVVESETIRGGGPPGAFRSGEGPGGGGAKWRLLVKHPSGSLEAAVASARRRNLFISTSVLGLLAASMVLIVVSTRRSQALARQQMEFVAAVSHELRTPLSVIRSAGENLADGIILDEAQIRRYGALVRTEGRRLTEMVEQILEFSGIHSGARALAIGPLDVRTLLESAVGACGPQLGESRSRVHIDVPLKLPAVAGEEAALRRVFQNLIGNAMKYGGDDGWIASLHAVRETRWRLR